MAYNYYPPYYTGAQPAAYQQNSGIIWVQGENAAKAYPVSAGQSLLLMDTEDNVMYIKSIDQSGMPLPLRIFDYKERTETKETSKTTEYISREEFNKFKDEIKDEIRRRKKIDEQPMKDKNA